MISLFQKSIRNLENVEDFEKGDIHTEIISFLTIEKFKILLIIKSLLNAKMKP
jgi:hypothetical protein